MLTQTSLLAGKELFRDAGVCRILKPFFPHIPALSSVEFLGEMGDVLHSGALFAPHPPASQV